MIKLTLNPEQDETSHVFEKEIVSIGSAAMDSPPGTIDLVLDNVPETLLIKLELREGKFFATNTKQTDELSLNGETFEELEIQSGDRLKVSDLIIEFEGEVSVGEESQDQLEDNFDLEEELSRLNDLFSDQDYEESSDEQGPAISDDDIEQLLADVDSLDVPEPSADSEGEELNSSEEEEGLAFLDDAEVDLALVEELDKVTPSEAFEEPEQIAAQEEESEKDSFTLLDSVEEEKSWESTSAEIDIEEDLLDNEEEAGLTDGDFYEEDEVFEQAGSKKRSYLVAVALTLLLLGGGFFATVMMLNKQNTQDQLIATRGLADVSMALMHAQVSNTLPYNNNPMDPDFLEEHLLAVLSPHYRLLSPIHTETSQLASDAYQIKVLADTDLTRYLVIAVPTDGIKQKIAPRPYLVYFSDSMEMLGSHRLQEWEAFHQSTISLDNIPLEDISKLLRDTDKLRMTNLNAGENWQGFTLPKELRHLVPEATEKLYNAPRYFSLTEPLIKEIPAASRSVLNARKLALFSQLFDKLTRYPYLVMYSSQDESSIQDAKSILDSGHMKRQALVGKITLDENHELITDVNVYLDDDVEKIALYYQSQESLTQGSEEALDYSHFTCDESPQEHILALDPNHPLFITLNEVASQRHQTLSQIGEKITQLLEEQSRHEVPDFYAKQQMLLQQYETASRSHQAKISRILSNLYQDYVGEGKGYSLEIFIATVKAADLEGLLPDHLKPEAKELEKSPQDNAHAALPLENAIAAIDTTEDLRSLNDLVKQLVESIHELEEGQPELSAEFHNRMRNQVLKRVGDLILSPNDHELPQTFHEQNRAVLNELLDNANVSDLEERQFYLNEFDLLMEKFRSISTQSLQELQKLDNQIVKDLENQHLDVSYRMSLEQQHAEVSEQIGQQREAIVDLKNQMSRLPITTATTSPEEQKQDLARLGQQILIQSSLKDPGSGRDEKLREAIALLVESTNENRSLWENILEARRLITETPQTAIEDILDSELGFSHSKQSLAAQIRNTMAQYINEQQALIQTQDEEHYRALFEAFRDKHRDNLFSVIEKTKLIQQNCQLLVTSLDGYIKRLEDFQNDYLRAKDEGFFYNNRRYHNIMSGRLEHKLKLAHAMRDKLRGTCKDLMDAAESHRQLCESELEKINEEVLITPELASQLIRESNAISYPNLLADSLGEELVEMIDIGVYPVSQ